MVVKRESEQSIDDCSTAGKSDEPTCSYQLSTFSNQQQTKKAFMSGYAEL
jgi:hypothetical protein